MFAEIASWPDDAKIILIIGCAIGIGSILNAIVSAVFWWWWSR